MLHLYLNQLTGNIPPELGSITSLEWLALSNNQLSGNIPPELGNLTNLRWLELRSNPLSGALPQTLKNMSLSTFWFDNTGLCEPADAAFQAWLASITTLQRTGLVCGPPRAYLPLAMRWTEDVSHAP